MHIYVMRHGQTVDNAHKQVSGDSETPLSELGKQQAKIAGKKAKELAIDLIVASSLGRAQETAKIVADIIGYPESRIVTMPELKERHLGDLEGHSYKNNERLNGNFPAVEHIRGVEPLAQFHARVQHALRQILANKKHQHILLVCHYGVGRMLQTVVADKPPHAMYDQPRLENGVIYTLL